MSLVFVIYGSRFTIDDLRRDSAKPFVCNTGTLRKSFFKDDVLSSEKQAVTYSFSISYSVRGEPGRWPDDTRTTSGRKLQKPARKQGRNEQAGCYALLTRPSAKVFSKN